MTANTTLGREARCPSVRVRVGERDIKKAIPANSSHCMIADAIHRQVPDAINVSVDIQTIRWSDRTTGKRYIYLTPVGVQNAILDFDEGKHPSPFVLSLRAGQITNMRQGQPWKKWRKNATKKRKKAVKAMKAAPKKRMLTSEDRNGAIPTIVGGSAPRETAVGRRRIFGIRGLVRGASA